MFIVATLHSASFAPIFSSGEVSARDASTITIIEEITYTILHIYRFLPRLPKRSECSWSCTTNPQTNQRSKNNSYTLQGINISHLGKRKVIFKMPFLGDMLVPWRVSIYIYISLSLYIWLTKNLPYLYLITLSAPGPITPNPKNPSWWSQRPSHLAMAKPGFQPCATPSCHRRRAAGHHHRPVGPKPFLWTTFHPGGEGCIRLLSWQKPWDIWIYIYMYVCFGEITYGNVYWRNEKDISTW